MARNVGFRRYFCCSLIQEGRVLCSETCPPGVPVTLAKVKQGGYKVLGQLGLSSAGVLEVPEVHTLEFGVFGGKWKGQGSPFILSLGFSWGLEKEY